MLGGVRLGFFFFMLLFFGRAGDGGNSLRRAGSPLACAVGLALALRAEHLLPLACAGCSITEP